MIRAAVSLSLLAALAAPVLVMSWHSLLLVGLVDESAGYRYYHGLRILHGEYPWLPQAHLLGLWHLILQLALTAVGYAETDDARLEVWIRLASLTGPVVIAAAYWWAVRPLSRPIRLLVAALVLAVAYELPTGGGYALLQPDYQPLCLAAALVMLGLSVRSPHWLTVALFAGACLAIKPTYTYWIPAMLALGLRSPRQGGLAVLATPVVPILTLLLYYRGDVVRHVEQLRYFVASAPPAPPFAVPLWPLTEHTAVVMLPVLMLGSVIGRPCWRTTLPLLAGYVPLLVVVARRPEPATWMEMTAFAAMALIAWGRTLPPVRFSAVLVLLAVVPIGWYAGSNAWSLLDANGGTVGKARSIVPTQLLVSHIINEANGPVAYLIPDVSALLPTVETARAKGMTDLST